MNSTSSQNISFDQAEGRGDFQLVHVYKNWTFLFMIGKRAHFPAEIATEDQANWESQNITIGTKPLFYSNRDPRRLTVSELYLDSTASGESLSPIIKRLRSLMDETDKGTPSTLLALWGDRQEVVVLTRLSIKEIFFARNGNPLRAQVNLELLQVQDRTGMNVLDADEPLLRTDGQIDTGERHR